MTEEKVPAEVLAMAELSNDEIIAQINQSIKEADEKTYTLEETLDEYPEVFAEFEEGLMTELESSAFFKVSDVEKKAPDWLIEPYIPENQITIIAGEGGVGKTSIWCNIAASVSSGKPSFFHKPSPSKIICNVPQKVLVFSAEDSFEYVLRDKLEKSGANLDNIYSIDIGHDLFKEVRYGSPMVERFVKTHRPKLCIFDPLQAFVDERIHMGERNAMRQALAPLIALGKNYGLTSIIIVHANKMANVWGRKRIADSADIWDIARSVLMVGNTTTRGLNYITHEKCNYGITGETILYTLDGGIVNFKGYSENKDADFIKEAQYTKAAPARDSAREFIIDFLKEGEQPVKDLDEMAKAMSISTHTLRRAKEDLQKEKIIQIKRKGNEGKGKGTTTYISLIDTEQKDKL